MPDRDPLPAVRLAASLIVRNEADFLDGCLDTLVGVVDEVVVYDTGSVDRSPDVARAHGAKVVLGEWPGAFDEARNLSLDECQADWVLWIDADERLAGWTSRDVGAVLDAADAEGAMGVQVLLRPVAGFSQYRELRLFRRHPEIRFEGVIHERIHPGIFRLGSHLFPSALMIEHLGYEGDPHRKHLRNHPLLEAAVARDPSDMYAWRHLALTREALSDAAGATQARAEALALLRAHADPRPADGLIFVDAIVRLLDSGGDASEMIAEALARFPENYSLVWYAAVAAEQAGHLDDAATLLERLEAVDAEGALQSGLAYPMQLFTQHAPAALGAVRVSQGRFDDAADAFERALASDPGNLHHQARAVAARGHARRLAEEAGDDG